ncbi:hypothetical protein PMAYCL1PPCAC_14200, partial [Pristionchus mayeri]
NSPFYSNLQFIKRIIFMRRNMINTLRGRMLRHLYILEDGDGDNEAVQRATVVVETARALTPPLTGAGRGECEVM